MTHYDNKEDKIQPGISIKREIWRDFKKNVQSGKASSEIESFMQSYTKGDDELSKLEMELKEKTEELKELESKKIDLESDISRIKNRVQTIRDKQDKHSDEFDRFYKTFSDKYYDSDKHEGHAGESDWISPEDIPDYWTDELEMDKKDLWDKATKEINL